MNRAILTVLAGVAILAGGCASDPYAKDLGEARPTVVAAVEAIGGIDGWVSAGPVTAMAMVTVYDAAGGGHVYQQEQVLDLAGGTIRATAPAGGGRWTASVPLEGPGRFETYNTRLTPELRGCIVEALRVNLHRVRGPLNVACWGEKPLGAAGPVRVGEENLLRLPVSGGPDASTVYYLDAATHRLRMVTVGGDGPGQEGTVTLYDWQVLPNGLSFPRRLTVMVLGQHTLVGERPVLEVDYTDVRF